MVPRRAMLAFSKKQSEVCSSLFCDCWRVVGLCYADTCFMTQLLEIPWEADLQLELLIIGDLVGKLWNITLC